MNRRRHGLCVCIAVALVLGASGGVAAEEQQAGNIRVAVMNFENNSTWTYWGDRLGEAAADELTTHLVKSGYFTVVERTQLDAVLAEQNLGQSGFTVNPATAAQMGQLLGVQLIFTGSISQFSIERVSGGFRSFGASYSRAETMLDIRMINTTTGEIMLAEDGQGEKRFGGGFFKGASAEREFDAGVASEALRPAVENVVAKVVRQADRLASLEPVAPEGQVVGARGESAIYINRGENVGIQVGQLVEVYSVVDEITDADGRVLDRIIEQVGVLEVTRVLSQSAVCRIVEGEAAEGDTVKVREGR